MTQDISIKYNISDNNLEELNAQAQEHSKTLHRILDEAHKKITGQHKALESMLVAIITDGHILVESVPGLAKTLMVKTVAQIFDADSIRIQFTPDLLPADIIGTKIYDSRSKSFVTQKGPIFHSFVLADEINRAPPKVQSALLEAMQEGQVTIHGDTHTLTKPFLVFATQNPIESEGTYKLPEAQTDRFAMKIHMTYPSKEEEVDIISKNTSEMYGASLGSEAAAVATATAISNTNEASSIQEFCKKVYVDKLISEYAVDIVQSTRKPTEYGLKKDIQDMIEYGASPRASIWLVKTAAAHALLEGRGFVLPEDIKFMAHNVLRHRIIPTFEAQMQDITSDAMITEILEKVNPP